MEVCSSLFNLDLARRRLLFLRVGEAHDSQPNHTSRVHLLNSMLSLDSQEQVRRSRRTEAGANAGVGSGQILGWGLLRLLSKVLV